METYKQIINKIKEFNNFKDLKNELIKIEFLFNCDKIKIKRKERILIKLEEIIRLLELEEYEKENELKDKRIKIKTIEDLIKLDII